MASEMVRPAVTGFLDTMLRDTDQNLRIEELTISKAFVGKTVADLPLSNFEKTLLVALKEKNQWTFNPKPGHPLNEQCVLILMTSPEDLQRLRSVL